MSNKTYEQHVGGDDTSVPGGRGGGRGGWVAVAAVVAVLALAGVVAKVTAISSAAAAPAATSVAPTWGVDSAGGSPETKPSIATGSPAAQTDWYGADPKDLAATLGATGYKAKPRDTTMPYRYSEGSAVFGGVLVNVTTYPTAKDEAKAALAAELGSGLLPTGVSVWYAVGDGGRVTQRLGDASLNAVFGRTSRKTAESAVAALPGFHLVQVKSSG